MINYINFQTQQCYIFKLKLIFMQITSKKRRDVKRGLMNCIPRVSRFFLLWGEGNKKNIEMQKCKKKLRHMLHIIIYETLSGATFFFYLILQASKRPYGM